MLVLIIDIFIDCGIPTVMVVLVVFRFFIICYCFHRSFVIVFIEVVGVDVVVVEVVLVVAVVVAIVYIVGVVIIAVVIVASWPRARAFCSKTVFKTIFFY